MRRVVPAAILEVLNFECAVMVADIGGNETVWLKGCVATATLPDFPMRIWQEHREMPQAMFDNLRDGPVPCVSEWGLMAFRQQLPNKVGRARVRTKLPQLGHHRIIALAVAPTSFSGTVRPTPVGPCAGRITNEQDVDEIGGSRCPVALYSRSRARRLCETAK